MRNGNAKNSLGFPVLPCSIRGKAHADATLLRKATKPAWEVAVTEYQKHLLIANCQLPIANC